MTDYKRSSINYSSGPLNYLDPNTMNNQSHLPQPSSILRSKSNNRRLSMASASRTSIIGTARNNIVNEFSNKRKSLISTPAPVSKKQQQQRLSYVPQFVPQSSSLSNINSLQSSQQFQLSQGKDSRPIRDKNYQVLIQQEIYDYLSNNKFELEMNHPLTTKTLKIPTQKDFVLIFQFLYRKIDPSYKFTKSIEYEVFLLLKTINYPYLDTINKSQISAVGGQNWPVFLGMIYWLVKLNSQLEKCDNDELVSPDDKLDQLFIDYIRKSYKAFIANEDDYSEFYNELRLNFDKVSEDLVQNIVSMKQKQIELNEEYNKISEKADIFINAEKKSKALESDLIKFKAYIETMENRKLKWSTVLEKINKEISNSDTELKEIEISKRKIEEQIKNQGLSPQDIDKLNNERDKLSKNIDNINIKLEENKSLLKTKEIDAIRNFESLENFLKKYNQTIFKIQSSNIFINDASLLLSAEYNFEIKLNTDIINSLDQIGVKPDKVIDKIIKDEKIKLLNFRNKISTNIHKYQDDSIKLQEQLDLISESINEKNEEIESMEAKLSAGKITYDELYETMTNDTTTSSSEIEKLERDLQLMRINSNQGFLKIEQRSSSIKIEYDQLLHKVSHDRIVLHNKIEKIIEFIINFKLNIQSNLEDFENFIVKECEKELNDS